MTRWIRETVITALIVALVVAWWRDRERTADLEAFNAKLDAYADSLDASRARAEQLAQVGDSLRRAQAQRDTVYLRGKTVYVAVRDSAATAAADTSSSAEQLRTLLAALTVSGDATIAACEDGRATCEARVRNADSLTAEARRETQLVRDSVGVEVNRVETENRSMKRELWRQRAYTMLTALGALAALIWG